MSKGWDLAVLIVAGVGWSGTALAQSDVTKPPLVAGLFAPPAQGKGQVVFFRRARHSDGYFDSCPIQEKAASDVKIATLKGNRYLVVQADPGVHRYWTKTEATDRLTLEVEPGETYFVECSMVSGIAVGRPNLSPSTADGFIVYRDKLKPQ